MAQAVKRRVGLTGRVAAGKERDQTSPAQVMNPDQAAGLSTQARARSPGNRSGARQGAWMAGQTTVLDQELCGIAKLIGYRLAWVNIFSARFYLATVTVPPILLLAYSHGPACRAGPRQRPNDGFLDEWSQTA